MSKTPINTDHPMRLQYPGISVNFDVCQSVAIGGAQHETAHAAMGLLNVAEIDITPYIIADVGGITAWGLLSTYKHALEIKAGFAVMNLGMESLHPVTTYITPFSGGTGATPVAGTPLTSASGDMATTVSLTITSGSFGDGTAAGLVEIKSWIDAAGWSVFSEPMDYAGGTMQPDGGGGEFTTRPAIRSGDVAQLPAAYIPAETLTLPGALLMLGLSADSMVVTVNGENSIAPGRVSINTDILLDSVSPFYAICSAVWPI